MSNLLELTNEEIKWVKDRFVDSKRVYRVSFQQELEQRLIWMYNILVVSLNVKRGSKNEFIYIVSLNTPEGLVVLEVTIPDSIQITSLAAQDLIFDAVTEYMVRFVK